MYEALRNWLYFFYQRLWLPGLWLQQSNFSWAAHSNSQRAETGMLAVQHILSETCQLEISIDLIS